ncbi:MULTISPECIES: YwqG family protein [Streptomyces]|uniref:YwqG family protein n=1 Tax=Streptomyces nondiastaticus TaxID=3154512 RepID=A0ABW6U5E1_9ACTN|nr:YwqG family protein [Streptomyces sp. VNUA116]WKU42726.1 YwqG family protein [Streptomyces sp. VNUA116]
MTQSSTEATLHALARKHLPADVAEKWIGLLRPGVRLTAAGDGDIVVGKLGGQPVLPEGMEWPVWEGHGPLSFIASVDCGALPVRELDIALPDDGTLAFFYFDGQLDEGTEAFLGSEAPHGCAGAQVLYIAAGAAVVERPTPEGLDAYSEVALTARVTLTAPSYGHPGAEEVLGGVDVPAELADAVGDVNGDIGHLVGGHAIPVQGPVEDEIAHSVLGPGTPWNDPRHAPEARRWTLLAQIDTDDDADMMWGDCGALYWLMRPEDLAEGRFDRARFTMQCC